MSAAARGQLRTVGVLSGEPNQGEGAEQVARAFKRAMASVRRLRGRETHRPGELTDAQYSLLFCLREPGQLSLREVAEAAELSPASATEMLDGLAEAGLVERIRSDRDRRVVLTSLTDAGRALVEGRRAQFEPRFRAALEPFSDDDLRTAAAVLDRLREFFEDLADERALDHGA